MQKITRRFIILIIIFVLFSMMSLIGMQTIADENSELVSPDWVYQYELTRYRTVGINETLDDSMYVRVASGYYDSHGLPIYAQGFLYLKGVAYGFPTANQKQGVYVGLVTAYI